MIKAPPLPPLQTQYFPLVGGIDAESAQLSIKPGSVIGAVNYESSALEGYERIGGFERFDGRVRPSDAAYQVFGAETTFANIPVGTVITGQTSGATAKVLALRGTSPIATEAWESLITEDLNSITLDDIYQLVVGRVTGTWQFGETILAGATVVGVWGKNASDITGIDDNVFYALAAADRRADIGAVPGSGPVRGIAVLGATVFAWRDNTSATACVIHKSTSSGWVAVDLMRELAFTAGSGTIPAEGATVTKGATTAVVKRVVTETGSWTAGTAAGRLIVTNVTSGPFTAGAFTAGMTGTASGADTAISLLPGGRLDHVVYNFTGSAITQRIYGADGVNKGFEFDGAVYVPISTGMVTDKPIHCTAHRNHLFFSFDGSLQHSAIGNPYSWSAVLGAAELAAGDVVTGFHVLPSDDAGGALMVFSRERTMVLYGSSSADWKFVNFAHNLGAQRWSVQSLGRVLVFDALGVATVAQSQSFGNFDRLPLSARIQSLLANRTVLASTVSRTKNRMRLFFSTGDSLSITPIGDSVAFMPINYGKAVFCATEALIGSEHRNFFGSDDGYVYEADRGRSFDGVAISAFMKLAFNHAKSPIGRKRFRRVDIEGTTESACRMSVYGEYSMGDPVVGLTGITEIGRSGLGAYYDQTNFEESFFDTPRHATNKVRLDGVGTDLSLAIVSNGSDELPHTLHSISTVFTPRRLDR